MSSIGRVCRDAAMPERSEYEIEIKAPAGRSFKVARPAGVFQLRSI